MTGGEAVDTKRGGDGAADYARKNGPVLARLSANEIHIGTSSWKYDGWQGIVYESAGGKEDPSNSYLRQYSRLYPTVCADFTFYRYPDAGIMQALARATPASFTFAVKVTQSLLIDRYPHWFKSQRAGSDNPEFLDPQLFVRQFLEPVQSLGGKLGPIIFEFGEKTMFLGPGAFPVALDGFFSKLPVGPLYAVEVRKKTLLTPGYFETLRRRGVAHVFNSQESAPPLAEQIACDGAFSAPHAVIRALTPPRISYKKSVKMTEPFDRVVLEDPGAVAAIAEIIRICRQRNLKLWAYINNRLEGCAPLTIARLLDGAAGVL